MDRRRAVAISLGLGVAGLALYFALARALFSLSLGELAASFQKMDLVLFALAILARGATPLLEAIQLYFSVMALGRRVSFRGVFRGMLASLATEYVLPIGGLVEVYKLFYLVRNSLSLNEASQIVFLHRFVLSLSMLAELLVVMLAMSVGLQLLIPLSTIVLILVGTNILGFIAFRISRVAEKLSRFLQRVRYLQQRYSYLFAFRAERVSLLPLVAALFFAMVERIAIGLSGYLTCLAMGVDMDFIEALLLFDMIQIVLWLVPMVTPGGLGMFETVQLVAIRSLGIEVTAASVLPLAYRLVTVVALLPQLLPAFVIDVLRAATKSGIEVEAPTLRAS